MKKVYVEYCKTTFKNIIDVVSTFDNLNVASLKINVEEKIRFKTLLKYLKKKNINKVSFVVSNVNYSNEVFKLIKSKKNPLMIQFIIENKLNKKDKAFFEKLNTIKRNFEVYDHTNFPNAEFFETLKNISYFKTLEEKYQNKMLYVYSNNGSTYCKNLSCLGKVVSFNKKGDIFFCPKNKENTYLMNIKDYTSFDDLFEKENFISYLEQTIAKRKECKSNCPYFNKCKGGCPLEDNCIEFKNYYNLAKKTINDVIINNINLNEVPLSVKENILWIICSRRK